MKHILIIDDSPSDVLVLKEAIKDSELMAEVDVVNDGLQAIKFLNREDNYMKVPRPDLIFLDLYLPVNGFEVLKILKQEERHRSIPVIIFSTSIRQEDIYNAYQLYANGYVIKPLDYRDLAKKLKVIEDFWFNTMVLPNKK